MGAFSEILSFLLSLAGQKCDEYASRAYSEYKSADEPTPEQEEAYNRSIQYMERRQQVSLLQAKRAYEAQLEEYEAAYSAAKENGDDEKIWELGLDIAKLEKAISEIEDYLDTYTDEEE